MPLVSVIIPTFNRFEQTAEAIRSALSQTEKDLEVIVVDDLSSDTSLDQLRNSFPTPLVKFVSTGKNSGAATGRNIGVNASSGTYVAFLDSDDFWLPEKISLQLQLLQSHACSPEDRVMVYAPAKLEYEHNGSAVTPNRPMAPSERVEEYIFVSGQHMQTSGWLMSRKFFDSVRFTPGLKRHQDLDFVIRAQALGCKFIMTSEPLYEWRHGTDMNHVGKVKDDGISVAWINSVRPLITKAAYHRFNIEFILPTLLSNNKIYSARIILSAALDGQLLLKKSMRTIARSVLSR